MNMDEVNRINEENKLLVIYKLILIKLSLDLQSLQLDYRDFRNARSKKKENSDLDNLYRANYICIKNIFSTKF